MHVSQQIGDGHHCGDGQGPVNSAVVIFRLVEWHEREQSQFEITASLLPKTLDGLYGMIYGLVAAVDDERTMDRALAIVGQFPDLRGETPLPAREAQTLTMELLLKRGMERGLEQSILASDAYQAYAAERDGVG